MHNTVDNAEPQALKEMVYERVVMGTADKTPESWSTLHLLLRSVNKAQQNCRWH